MLMGVHCIVCLCDQLVATSEMDCYPKKWTAIRRNGLLSEEMDCYKEEMDCYKKKWTAIRRNGLLSDEM